MKNKGCPIYFEGSPTLPPVTDVSKILNAYNMTENLKLFVNGSICESVEKVIFLLSLFELTTNIRIYSIH